MAGDSGNSIWYVGDTTSPDRLAVACTPLDANLSRRETNWALVIRPNVRTFEILYMTGDNNTPMDTDVIEQPLKEVYLLAGKFLDEEVVVWDELNDRPKTIAASIFNCVLSRGEADETAIFEALPLGVTKIDLRGYATLQTAFRLATDDTDSEHERQRNLNRSVGMINRWLAGLTGRRE